jgi:hypothetical protein
MSGLFFFSLFLVLYTHTMSLWPVFYKGEKQNGSHYSTYCKACVDHHKSNLETAEFERGEELDATGQLATDERSRKEMAKWIGDAHVAKEAEELDDETICEQPALSSNLAHTQKWAIPAVWR